MIMPPIMNSMKKDNSQLEAPKSKLSSILPPNNPKRPDWGILSDSLGLPSHEKPAEGSTPAQAAAQMRALLFSCLKTTETYDAIIMKCAGAVIAARTKEDTAAKANFAELMAFIRSRLWNRRADGTKTISKLGREHSSNDIISAWNPEAGGIGKYISVNVANILNRDWKSATMEISDSRKVSLEVLADKGRHLSTTGRFYDAETAEGGQYEATEYVEADESLERTSQILSASQKRQISEDIDGEEGRENEANQGHEYLLDGDGVLGADPEEGPPITESRREFDVALIASRNATPRSDTLRSPQHPDYRIFAAALIDDMPEPELDEAGRINQLRNLAGKVMAMHCADLDDYEESREAIQDWNPSEVPFARFFPEVCVQVADSLNQADGQQVRDQSLGLQFAAEFIIIGNEITRQSQKLNPRPNGMSAEDWDDITRNAKNWLGRECTASEELMSADRPDYIALSHLTGRRIDRAIKPEAMGELLKVMYKEWTANQISSAAKNAYQDATALRAYSENAESIREMNKRMEAWQPLKDGFAGETMNRHLHQVRLEMEAREEVARASFATEQANVSTKLSTGAGHVAFRPATIPIENDMFADVAFAPKPAETEPYSASRPPHSEPTQQHENQGHAQK